MGAAEYFERQDAVDEAVAGNVHRLQLHPAYSYEEFIRGLHLDENGRAVYRPGFLPRLVHRMAQDRDGALPHVVVLDEMNRADLSRVFGEAFSLLENRGDVTSLPMSLADKPWRGRPRRRGHTRRPSLNPDQPVLYRHDEPDRSVG